MITVKELIEKLHTVDPDLVVLVPGYEGGYREVEFSNHVRKLRRDAHDEWYYGPHDEIFDGRPEDFQGIVL